MAKLTMFDSIIKEGKTFMREDIDPDKWRRVYNGKPICVYRFHFKDPYENKKIYAIVLKYKESIDKDIIYFSEYLTNISRINFSVKNLSYLGKKTFELNEISLDSSTFENQIIKNFQSEDFLKKSLSSMQKKLFKKTLEDSVKNWIRGVDNIEFIKF